MPKLTDKQMRSVMGLSLKQIQDLIDSNKGENSITKIKQVKEYVDEALLLLEAHEREHNG